MGTTTKRPRLSAEETRNRLIDAGIEALRDSGISIGLDAVSLEQAVRDADVSRSSAYAVWSEGDYEALPQERFQDAVLRHAIDVHTKTLAPFEAGYKKLFAGAVGLSKPEMLREVIRVLGAAHIERIETTTEWRLMIALRSILHSTPVGQRDEQLQEWMRASEEAIRLDTINLIYRPIMEMLGLKPRPEYGEDAYHYAETAASSLTEGLAIRSSLNNGPPQSGLQHPEEVDPDKEWTVYALIFEQITSLFFMPIDESEWSSESD